MNERISRLYRVFDEKNIDAVLLTDGYNIHYLSGYRGHTGCMLVMKEDIYILTDSRYTEQVQLEAPDVECVDIGATGYAGALKKLIPPCTRLGFENYQISYRDYMKYREAFDESISMTPLDGSVDALRQVKSDYELSRLNKAEEIGDKAFNEVVKLIKAGMTEAEVALSLECVMRKNGASGTSFDTIAASGNNSSLPHAVPTDKRLENGDFLTMDFGCVYDGYCSDMTRTVYIGDKPDDKKLHVYNTVLKAQLAALDMVEPGVKCSDVDACARDIIADAGYGDYFGHGLGHSVGLFIHEEPRFSPKCDDILKPGVVITVEPGIYLPGEFGVRIEDMVAVTEDGYVNFAHSPKELICIN